MRILHVIYDDIHNPWVGGGGATRTLEIYSRIVSKGHKVLIVCGNYPGAPRVETRNGLRYRHVGSPRSHLLSRITFMLGARRAVRRATYDIVIEDVSAFSPIGSPLWNRCKPAVASVQNVIGTHATEKYGLFGWIPFVVEKLLLPIYKHFVAVSPGIANQLTEALGHDIDVRTIPNSASPLFFREGESRDGTSQAGDPYILSLGRIDIYQKGLDTLIEAFEQIAERLPDVRLLIAGGGMDAQVARLKALVEKSRHRSRIELLGHVDQAQAAKLMGGALLVAIPSRYEGWPLAAIEAGASGVPVVGTDIVGVRDAAPQYPEGHSQLVPPDDVDAMAEALYRVATDGDLRGRMSAKATSWSANFAWDGLAEKQLGYYEEICGAEF